MLATPPLRMIALALAITVVGVSPEAASGDQQDPTAPTDHSVDAGNWIYWAQDPARPQGVFIVELQSSNPFSIGITALYTFDGDFVGPHATLITREGKILSKMVPYDGARWGEGEGVAYGGVAQFGVRTPQSPTTSPEETYFAGGRIDAPAGQSWLIISYRVPATDLELDISVGAPATEVTRYEGPLMAVFELADLTGGVKAGTGAAVAVHASNEMDYTSSSDDILSIVYYMRSDAGAAGRADFSTGPHTFQVDFTRPLNASACSCWDEGEVVTLGPDFRLGFTYAGYARNTRLYGYVAEIPRNFITVEGGIFHQEIAPNFEPPP